MAYPNILSCIGNTPLVELQDFAKKRGISARILAKVESFNPLGSVKDRAALYMIQDAIERKVLKQGSVIIEPTSGNTGVGLAYIGSMLGYPVILTMPESMSVERRALLLALGAKLVLTPAIAGMQGAIDKAHALQKEYEDAVILGQFENPANATAHYETTGPEIWEESNQQVDVFVAGIGTGGTITGAGRFLKEQNQEVTIIGVEPKKSAVLSGEAAGPHGLMGIGAGFVPKVLDVSLLDEVVTIQEEDAYQTARALAKEAGLFVGISSGAAMYATMQIAQREAYSNSTIVTVLPDTGERYLSTPLFEQTRV